MIVNVLNLTTVPKYWGFADNLVIMNMKMSQCVELGLAVDFYGRVGVQFTGQYVRIGVPLTD